MRKTAEKTKRLPDNPPAVSVVIPSFNSAWSINDTILSVRHQTLEDFELIVIDDGSSDNLQDIMAPHLADDPRIRIIHQENRGLAGARNRGLSEATGDYVAFLDADDIWHPDFLKMAVTGLAKNPDAPYAFAYSFRMDINNRLIGWPLWKRPPPHDFEGMLVLNVVGNGSAAVYRRLDAIAIGGFDETMHLRGAFGAEDWKFCIQLAATGEPVLIPRPMVGYRFVQTSMSQSNPSRQMEAVMAVMRDIRALFPGVSERYFADAQVTMNGWLLPAFMSKKMYGTVAKMLIESYVLHPLWFRNQCLRSLHWMKLVSIAKGVPYLLTGRRPPRIPLPRLQEDGDFPYAFLTVHSHDTEASFDK